MKTFEYGLLALGVSIVSSLCSAFITWFFVLRSTTYQSNVAALEKKKEQLEELNAKDDDDKATAKKKKKLRNDIKALTQTIAQLSLKGNIISTVFFIVFGRLARSSFAGLVCAKIPFEPFPFLARMTHAGIENEDFTDGSYTYMYWLGNMFIRDAINKFFGIEMPKMDFTSMMDQQNLE